MVLHLCKGEQGPSSCIYAGCVACMRSCIRQQPRTHCTVSFRVAMGGLHDLDPDGGLHDRDSDPCNGPPSTDPAQEAGQPARVPHGRGLHGGKGESGRSKAGHYQSDREDYQSVAPIFFARSRPLGSAAGSDEERCSQPTNYLHRMPSPKCAAGSPAS